MVSEQINRWADRIWNLAQVHEIYAALESFREEVLSEKTSAPLERSVAEGYVPRQLDLFANRED